MFSDEEKEAFIKTWVSLGDPWQAALQLSPDNPGKALLWAKLEHDTDVKKRYEEAKNNIDEASLLPSKYDIARMYLAEATTARMAVDRLRAMRQYAELMGFIVKPDGKASIGVIAVPMSVTDERL